MNKETKSDLLVIQEMIDNEKFVAAAPTIVEVKKVNAGGLVTMGVDWTTAEKLIFQQGKYAAILYVVDYEEFKRIKSEPQEPTASHTASP